MEKPEPKVGPMQKMLAWGVHLFTALGILPALFAIIAVGEGQWQAAYLWLFVALVIDGVDGTLARLTSVEVVLPRISGKMIDSVIDFTTYAIIPAYFFYTAGLGPAGWNMALAGLMLVAAVLYYGKEGMISESMHFVGFPVLWNVVVFFLFFVLSLPPWVNASLIVLFSVLHFVPLRYAYPSRALRMQGLTLLVSAAGLLAALGLLWIYPQGPIWLKSITLLSLTYFVVLVVVDSFLTDAEQAE